MKKISKKKQKLINKLGIRKRTRGRSSGATTKETKYQSRMIDEGYMKIHNLLYNLIRD